jgi:hypothetical protein
MNTRIRFSETNPFVPWDLSLHAMRQTNDPSKVVIIHSPKEEVVDRNEMHCSPDFKPLLIIDRRDPGLTDLMDSLWALGIRPSDIGTPGHLAATQKHLEDMRKLAFHPLGIPL